MLWTPCILNIEVNRTCVCWFKHLRQFNRLSSSSNHENHYHLEKHPSLTNKRIISDKNDVSHACCCMASDQSVWLSWCDRDERDLGSGDHHRTDFYFPSQDPLQQQSGGGSVAGQCSSLCAVSDQGACERVSRTRSRPAAPGAKPALPRLLVSSEEHCTVG